MESKKKVPLYSITSVAEALPFQTIAMDFIVKLPESGGCDSILTITDHDCTKMVVAIPCRETINAEEVANLFLRQIFPRFGLPSKVISDRDPRFTSKFMKELCRLCYVFIMVHRTYPLPLLIFLYRDPIPLIICRLHRTASLLSPYPLSPLSSIVPCTIEWRFSYHLIFMAVLILYDYIGPQSSVTIRLDYVPSPQ